jgi:hypothetical protein
MTANLYEVDGWWYKATMRPSPNPTADRRGQRGHHPRGLEPLQGREQPAGGVRDNVDRHRLRCARQALQITRRPAAAARQGAQACKHTAVSGVHATLLAHRLLPRLLEGILRRLRALLRHLQRHPRLSWDVGTCHY